MQEVWNLSPDLGKKFFNRDKRVKKSYLISTKRNNLLKWATTKTFLLKISVWRRKISRRKNLKSKEGYYPTNLFNLNFIYKCLLIIRIFLHSRWAWWKSKKRGWIAIMWKRFMYLNDQYNTAMGVIRNVTFRIHSRTKVDQNLLNMHQIRDI